MIVWDGSSWQVHSKPAAAALDDVHMLNASDGWAVGGVSSTTETSSIFATMLAAAEPGCNTR